MAHNINPGASLNLTPAPTKQAAAGNYLDFTTQSTSAADLNWAQQYLPDLMEKEAEVFGNRTVSGFLAQVGAEEAMASDQVVWSEQGRLHLSYPATITTAATTLVTMASADHGIRVGDTVVISSNALTVKAYVSAINVTVSGVAKGITVLPYTAADLTAFGNAATVNVFVYGSEYAKGSAGRGDVITPKFQSYTNKPIILKDKYEVSGSDASAIGWVEVTGEEGQNGYLWYLKASGDTKARFADYCEMALIEAEKKIAGTSTAPVSGTEGLFAAIADRGNISTQVSAMVDFDTILKEFDKQGAIEENMMFLNRTQALDIDDMLAGMSTTSSGGGAAYGVFDNDEDMALNLGFSGFRRGSYDFYKTDWKYLNDVATRGGALDVAAGTSSDGLGGVLGVIVPAGVSTVYDQSLGKNLKRPFLHVRYRASGLESRKMKTWTTGSVGAVTSDIDTMEMHFLSERCLVVQGANNFMLLKGNLAS
tara:strand:- start:3805 stop:5241 length:1437 start_codon:yes stop_codon:yes gene_type:complete